MARYKRVFLVLTLSWSFFATPASAAGFVLRVASPSVTASESFNASSISVRLINESNAAVLVTSIWSPDASESMLFYDVNMCQGGHAMSMLNNILVPAHGIQQLGYKFQGSMLQDLSHAFVLHKKVPLIIDWIGNGIHETRVMAVVVTPPRGLRFSMSSMKM
jgi:copper(I)-binding protein